MHVVCRTWGHCDEKSWPIVRVLVLGSGGMVGHKLIQVLARDMHVWGTSSRESDYISRFTGVAQDRILDHFDALSDRDLIASLNRSNPDVVINAIGLVKQHDQIVNEQLAFRTNVELPRRIAKLTASRGARFVHLSTDCVFTGRKGAYIESDDTDAIDVYGVTKAQGELDLGEALVIRTSYIGRELRHFYGLMEWLHRQPPGDVPGYANAIWSGLPTVVFAQIMFQILSNAPELSGTYHIATKPLSKYELLQGITEAVHGPWHVIPVEEPHADLSLDAAKFVRDTGIDIPTWPQMFAILAQDSTLYDHLEARD